MNLLLTIFIYSLPLGVLSRFELLPNIFIYLNDVLAGILASQFIYRAVVKKDAEIDKKILLPIMGFFIVGFISLILSFNNLTTFSFFASFLYSVRYAVYVLLIFIVTNLPKKSIASLTTKILISGMVFIGVGFIQYFYYPNLRNLSYLGWDEHQFRLFSTYFDPNFAGIFIVIIFLVFFVRVISVFERKLNNKVLLPSIGCVASLAAIYFTHSRSAFISLLVGIFVILFLLKRIKLLVPIVAGFLLLFFVFSDLRAEGMNPLRVVSSESRLLSAAQAAEIFIKRPLFGVGFDSYRYVRFTESNRTDIGSIRSNAGAGTDNSYLFVLVTTGIVGFAFFVKFWIEVISRTFVKVRKTKIGHSTLPLATLASLSAVLIDSLFINTLFYPLIMSYVFILIGAVISKDLPKD